MNFPALIAFLFLFNLAAFAKPKAYMRCLGQEEFAIHKRNAGGPVYKLNQEIISSLVQLRDSIYMKKKFVKKVCASNSPSLKVLELLMTEEELFFSSHNPARDPKRHAIDQSTIEDLREKSALLFIGFTGQMQAGLPKAGCLQRHVPQLEKFFEQMRYLVENIGLKRVMKALKEPQKIFDKLQSLDVNKMKC